MNDLSDAIRISRIREAQKSRIANQSWDYVNTNGKDYPELIVAHHKYPGMSVQDVRKLIPNSLVQKLNDLSR